MEGKPQVCLPRPGGGEGGIRTPETLAGLRAFQARALGHYATSPRPQQRVACETLSLKASLRRNCLARAVANAAATAQCFGETPKADCGSQQRKRRGNGAEGRLLYHNVHDVHAVGGAGENAQLQHGNKPVHNAECAAAVLGGRRGRRTGRRGSLARHGKRGERVGNSVRLESPTLNCSLLPFPTARSTAVPARRIYRALRAKQSRFPLHRTARIHLISTRVL